MRWSRWRWRWRLALLRAGHGADGLRGVRPGAAALSPALDRLAAIGIASCALGFGLLYAGLFLRDNGAPQVDLSGVGSAPVGQFFHATTQCQVRAERVQVQGWAVRKGYGWPLTHSRVVMRLADGRAVALETAMLDSQPLADVIHAHTQDQRTYYAARFAAALNPAVAGVDVRGARLFFDWEQGPVRVLLPLHCPQAQR